MACSSGAASFNSGTGCNVASVFPMADARDNRVRMPANRGDRLLQFRSLFQNGWRLQRLMRRRTLATSRHMLLRHLQLRDRLFKCLRCGQIVRELRVFPLGVFHQQADLMDRRECRQLRVEACDLCLGVAF